MMKIYRKSADWLTVAEAKRLVSGVTDVASEFVKDCKRLGIAPRMTHRPVICGYNGEGIYQDLMYSLTHDEFVKYAGHHGVSVVLTNDDRTLT